MTNVTRLAPRGACLESDLKSAQEALSLARGAAAEAGAGAMAYSRVTIYTESPEAVDAVAAAWGTRARWTPERHYVARAGDGSAEAEAVYIAPKAQAAA